MYTLFWVRQAKVHAVWYNLLKHSWRSCKQSQFRVCFWKLILINICCPPLLSCLHNSCSCRQIDTWCKENNYVIVAYYQANERTKDSRYRQPHGFCHMLFQENSHYKTCVWTPLRYSLVRSLADPTKLQKKWLPGFLRTSLRQQLLW